MLMEFKPAAVFTSSVTVKPPSINTSSPATGIAAPGAPPDVFDQVAVEFHVPVATLYTLSASALFNKMRKRKMKVVTRLKAFIHKRLEDNVFLLIKYLSFIKL
jgi:hypothetical protein